MPAQTIAGLISVPEEAGGHTTFETLAADALSDLGTLVTTPVDTSEEATTLLLKNKD